MAIQLDDATVKTLPLPASGTKVYYDLAVRGFGVRVTANGARSFVLNYRRRDGRERRYTIGTFGKNEWSTAAARKEAGEIKRRLKDGYDPLAIVEADKAAPLVNDLWDRYEREHLPRKRSQADDRRLWRLYAKPALGQKKVTEVKRGDIIDLHREASAKAPIQANRMLAMLSKMFSLAVIHEMRADNPCRGVERNDELPRERELKPDERKRLIEAINAYPGAQTANLLRFVMLTGCRVGEALAASWEQVDLTAGIWTKPSAHTKQKRVHRVPLNAPARQLLSDIRAKVEAAAKRKRRPVPAWIFPNRAWNGPQEGYRVAWLEICKAADLENLRVHDLRHAFASQGAAVGLSLPMIGALLGHTQARTTQRYAHLYDDPLKAATDAIAKHYSDVVAVPEPAAEGQGR